MKKFWMVIVDFDPACPTNKPGSMVYDERKGKNSTFRYNTKEEADEAAAWWVSNRSSGTAVAVFELVSAFRKATPPVEAIPFDETPAAPVTE